MHCQSRVLAHEDACRARVVEVDVREQKMAEIGDREAVVGESFAQRLDRRCRPAVEERRPFGRLEELRRDDALVTEVAEVD